MMNDANVVAVELPRQVEITGARGVKRIADLSAFSPATIVAAIEYAGGVISQRAGASETEIEEKKQKELEALERFCSGKWVPGAGGGGGGSPLTVERRAEIAVLAALFEAQGRPAGKAEKAARTKTAWYDVGLAILSAKTNRRDVPRGDVEVFLAKNREYFNGLITTKVREIRATEDAARETLDGLTF